MKIPTVLYLAWLRKYQRFAYIEVQRSVVNISWSTTQCSCTTIGMFSKLDNFMQQLAVLVSGSSTLYCTVLSAVHYTFPRFDNGSMYFTFVLTTVQAAFGDCSRCVSFLAEALIIGRYCNKYLLARLGEWLDWSMKNPFYFGTSCCLSPWQEVRCSVIHYEYSRLAKRSCGPRPNLDDS